MNPARERGENAAESEGQNLVQSGVDAHHRGGFFVFPDGDQAEAKAAARDPEDSSVVTTSSASASSKKSGIPFEERQNETDIAACDFEIGNDRGHHLREPKGGDREVVARNRRTGNPSKKGEQHRQDRRPTSGRRANGS